MSESADVNRAWAFNTSRWIEEGVDYKWVIAHAKEQYARAMAAYKTADEKAASLLGYLGGGLGLLLLGIAGAIAEGKVSPVIGLAGVPAFIAAAASLSFAVLARRPYSVAFGGPEIEWATRAACLYVGHDPTIAEAAGLGQWDVSTSLITYAVQKKALWFRRATWCLLFAVALLLLPLLTAIVLKWPLLGA